MKKHVELLWQDSERCLSMVLELSNSRYARSWSSFDKVHKDNKPLLKSSIKILVAIEQLSNFSLIFKKLISWAIYSINIHYFVPSPT